MIDREKVLTVLARRFPGAGADQIAATANAIVGLTDEPIDVGASVGIAIAPYDGIDRDEITVEPKA